jgi:hypothetical protein
MKMSKVTQKLVRWLLAGSIIVSFSAALAQNATMPGQPTGLTCMDFQHNPDGSWSPIHPVRVGSVMMSPGVAFNPGVQLAVSI